MSKVATKIYAFENKKLVEYNGDYHYYMTHKPALQERTASRYVDGSMGIRPALRPELAQDDKKRKSFGGSGASGRSDKGIKNAGRFQ